MTAVDVLKRELERTPGIRLAVLFGSAARGGRAARDLDVGVTLEEGADPSPHLAGTLERAAGRPVDLLRLEGAPPLLRYEIARDGVLLLERHASDWAAFRARAMIDWWDWAPTATMMHRTMAARLREEAARGSS